MPDLVPTAYSDTDADVRRCPICGTDTFHVPQRVMLLSPGGARKVRVWACETHPYPSTIVDEP